MISTSVHLRRFSNFSVSKDTVQKGPVLEWWGVMRTGHGDMGNIYVEGLVPHRSGAGSDTEPSIFIICESLKTLNTEN